MSKLLLSFAPKFTHLQSLNLHQNQHQRDDQEVEMVAKYCHDLCALDLLNSTQLIDRSINALALGCNQLEKLDISGCSKVIDSALIFLAAKCNRLRHLNLCGSCQAAYDRVLLIGP